MPIIIIISLSLCSLTVKKDMHVRSGINKLLKDELAKAPTGGLEPPTIRLRA
jgi:hypothetical protein